MEFVIRNGYPMAMLKATMKAIMSTALNNPMLKVVTRRIPGNHKTAPPLMETEAAKAREAKLILEV